MPGKRRTLGFVASSSPDAAPAPTAPTPAPAAPGLQTKALDSLPRESDTGSERSRSTEPLPAARTNASEDCGRSSASASTVAGAVAVDAAGGDCSYGGGGSRESSSGQNDGLRACPGVTSARGGLYHLALQEVVNAVFVGGAIKVCVRALVVRAIALLPHLLSHLLPRHTADRTAPTTAPCSLSSPPPRPPALRRSSRCSVSSARCKWTASAPHTP